MREVVIAAEAEPLDPGTWSGISYGLAGGLRAHGVDAAGVSSAIGNGGDRVLRVALAARYRNRRSAAYGPELDWVRSRVVARRLRACRADAIIQLSTRFRVPAAPPLATLQDATVLQGTRAQERAFSGVRRSVIDGWTARQREIYRSARACCCATEWTRRSVIDEYAIAPGKVHVVGFGRNLDVDPLPRDWETPRFLWIGRDWERKNGARVLRAFAEVRRVHPQATIDFVGDHPRFDGHEGARGHGVLRLGEPSDAGRMRSLLQSATCFVMPSLYEPFGMVYVEAGAAGVPSIGTTYGGATEAIGPGGAVIDPADEAALVGRMLQFADGPTARAAGVQAIAHAAGFTWSAVAGRMLAVLSPATGAGG